MENVLGKYFDNQSEEFFKDSPNRIFLTIQNVGNVDTSISLFDMSAVGNTTYSYFFNDFFTLAGSTAFSMAVNANGVNSLLISVGPGPVLVTVAQILAAFNALGYGTWSTYFNGTTYAIYKTFGSNIFFGNLTSASIFGSISILNIIPVTTSFMGSLVITGSVPYSQLVYAQLGSAYKINRMWAQSSNSNQLLQPFDIKYKNSNGDVMEYVYSPIFDPYQNNTNATRPMTFDDFILNADTIIKNYTILGNQTVTLLLDYTKAAPYDPNNDVETKNNDSEIIFPNKARIVKNKNMFLIENY